MAGWNDFLGRNSAKGSCSLKNNLRTSGTILDADHDVVLWMHEKSIDVHLSISLGGLESMEFFIGRLKHKASAGSAAKHHAVSGFGLKSRQYR